MKKLLTMVVVLLLLSFSTSEPTFNINESINTLEDMKEWMMYDIDVQDVNREKGEMYIKNIDEVLQRLRQL